MSTEKSILTVSTDGHRKLQDCETYPEKSAMLDTTAVYELDTSILPLTLHPTQDEDQVSSSMERVAIVDQTETCPMNGGKEPENDTESITTARKSRRELPPQTVALLKGWMLSPEHIKHPYPTDADKQMLLHKTGLNMKQLTNWFTNARKRIWKPMMRQQQTRHLQRSLTRESLPISSEYSVPTSGHRFDNGMIPSRMAYSSHSMERVDGSMQGRKTHLNANMYPPRTNRSMSESATMQARHTAQNHASCLRKRSFLHTDELEMDRIEKRFRDAPLLSPHAARALERYVQSKPCESAYVGYPSESERRHLAIELSVPMTSIDQWFQSYQMRPQRRFRGNSRRFGANTMQRNGHTAQECSTVSEQDESYLSASNSRSIPARNNPLFPPPGNHTHSSSVPWGSNSLYPSSLQSTHDHHAATRRGPFRHVPLSNLYHNSQHQETSLTSSIRTCTITSDSSRRSTQLPSLSSSTLPLPAPTCGPSRGQPRDNRCHTLDMGVLADARRRKMNFLDVLESSKKSLSCSARSAPVSCGLKSFSSCMPTSTNFMLQRPDLTNLALSSGGFKQ